MTPIVHVPSEWILAYWLGIGVLIYAVRFNKNVGMFAFAGVFAYFLGLTIGLRMFYG